MGHVCPLPYPAAWFTLWQYVASQFEEKYMEGKTLERDSSHALVSPPGLKQIVTTSLDKSLAVWTLEGVSLSTVASCCLRKACHASPVPTTGLWGCLSLHQHCVLGCWTAITGPLHCTAAPPHCPTSGPGGLTGRCRPLPGQQALRACHDCACIVTFRRQVFWLGTMRA